jgi:hypothetical protein
MPKLRTLNTSGRFTGRKIYNNNVVKKRNLFEIFLLLPIAFYVSCVTLFRMGQVIIEQFQQPWLEHPWIFSLSALGREHDQLLKTLHGFTESVSLNRLSLRDVIKYFIFYR